MVTFRPAVPVLRIFDEAKAREFYLGFLGCALNWEHRFEPGLPLYCQVRRGEFVLHLSEHHGDGTPGGVVLVWMSGIDNLRAELLDKRYPYARPGIETASWGARVMEVADPFGNRLRFAERPE